MIVASIGYNLQLTTTQLAEMEDDVPNVARFRSYFDYLDSLIAEEDIKEKPDLIKPELVKMEEEPDGDTIRWPSQDIGCQYAKGKVEAPGEYFFENDHLAMLEEGRDDLQVLLRTLAVLEAQKVTIFTATC